MRFSHQRRLRLVLFLAVALGSITAASVAYGIAFFEDFESQSVDTRFAIRGATGTPKDIVDVNVDDTSLYRVRAASVLLPEGDSWISATEKARQSDAGVPIAWVPFAQ